MNFSTVSALLIPINWFKGDRSGPCVELFELVA